MKSLFARSLLSLTGAICLCHAAAATDAEPAAFAITSVDPKLKVAKVVATALKTDNVRIRVIAGSAQGMPPVCNVSGTLEFAGLQKEKLDEELNKRHPGVHFTVEVLRPADFAVSAEFEIGKGPSGEKPLCIPLKEGDLKENGHFVINDEGIQFGLLVSDAKAEGGQENPATRLNAQLRSKESGCVLRVRLASKDGGAAAKFKINTGALAKDLGAASFTSERFGAAFAGLAVWEISPPPAAETASKAASQVLSKLQSLKFVVPAEKAGEFTWVPARAAIAMQLRESVAIAESHLIEVNLDSLDLRKNATFVPPLDP